ncbi:MAG: M1 family aminopeptidase/hydrolase, partial [Bacteroidota bacterium]
MKPPIIDTHSYANPDVAKVTHLSLDLTADFVNKALYGKVTHQIEHDGAEEIIFDAKYLTIEKVEVDQQEVSFDLGKDDPIKGQSISVPLEANSKSVSIYYRTTAQSQALLWIDPIQTTGKIHPFLFTQGQAILTRSWIPCQDSPGIRITYDAKIKVPEDLMAVMSASNPISKTENGLYTFEMKQAIPSYLIALAIGDLEFAPIGSKTGVYAEPAMLQRAVYEFGDMEKMLVAAEELYGEYLWERYDVIVLPPSFPFGGMENPRLTFATPTILAGDRSLTALIAHELAHSWSGNLVTNATWNDFWLNEGFTVYFERRIMEAIYGEEYTKMLTMLGHQDLKHTIEDLGPTSNDTKLYLDLKGRDPDDGMTDIAYEKGAHFLMLLEEKVGRENFDVFLNEYFNTYKFKSIDTESFKKYLKTNLLDKYNVDVDIDQWIHVSGLPSNCPITMSDRFVKIDDMIASMQSAEDINAAATKDWTTHEWLHFIR